MVSYVRSFRGNMNRLIADVQLFQYLFVLFGLFTLSLGLYEDQVGKFDWRQPYVGKIKFATFDTVSTAKKIIVATEENVIAALNIKSGQILWRRVLEKGCNGKIRYLGGVKDGELISVSGGVPAVVRAWDLGSGHSLNVWVVAEPNPERLEDVKWHVSDGALHHILPLYNGVVEVTSYDTKTGEKLRTKKIPASFIDQETKCVLAIPFLVYLKGNDSLALLFFVDLFNNAEVQSITMNTIFGAGSQGPYNLESVRGGDNVIVVSSDNGRRKRVIVADKVPIVIERDIDGDTGLHVTVVDGEEILLETTYKDGMTHTTAVKLREESNPPTVSSLSSIIHASLLSPAIMASSCSRQSKGLNCQHLVLSEDHAVALLQQNQLIWSREEALANIVAVEILELPMSDRDQTIETEFDQKERDVIGMITRRISAQANQAKILLQTAFGVIPQMSNQRADLVRDKFGLHKMIVVVTAAGKLYGIETRKGEIIWQLRVKEIEGLTKNSNSMILYVQRGSIHFPHPPQCALLATDKISGEGIVYTFNPISGQTLGGVEKLGYKIKQSMLLHAANEEFLRPILILDSRDKIHVHPESATAVVAAAGKSTYLFTADRTTGVLSGFSLSYSTAQESVAHKVWELVMSPKSQRISQVVSKNPLERVHSQGRVLGDRSVLYKYINPNLVTIVTEGVGAHKNTLNLYLLDVVSGSMIFSIVHKRVRGPIHVVHSENWVLYSYYNEKSRRTEIAALELYEGKVQSNNTVFSSLTTTRLPIVERQAFIFPATIESMRETITEKGITSKHIMVSLANGGILELPWMLVDPRRPTNPEIREEGVIPYMPEIPIHMDAIVNYNQSVFRVSGIHTSPSGLESTCLVFVHGLDLYYTRVAPSKNFDVLKEDFDYYLIVIVLAALLISSYVTKKLASQKAQKQAWK